MTANSKKQIKVESKILIVEDDVDMQETLSKICNNCGFESVCVSSVEGLQSTIKQFTPSLILLDVALPGMDGLTILRKLHKIPRFQKVPIVIVSGNADLAEINVSSKAKSLGCDAFIYKPFQVEEVICTIETLVTRESTDEPSEELGGSGESTSSNQEEMPQEQLTEEEGQEPTETPQEDPHEASEEPVVASSQEDLADSDPSSIEGLPAEKEDINDTQQSTLECDKPFIKRFLRKMSHDLRGPIGTITGMTDCMKMGMDGEISTEQKNTLKKISDSCKKLVGMINEVSEILSIKAVRAKARFEMFAPIDLIDYSIANFQDLADFKKIEIKKECPEGEFLVEMDPKMMQRVVDHLLQNAIVFTSVGSVTLSLSEIQDGMYHITIQDTGAGIEKDLLKGIKESFQKDKNQVEKLCSYKGFGLLYCYTAIEMHGGSISVESSGEGGTKFTLSLPADPS